MGTIDELLSDLEGEIAHRIRAIDPDLSRSLEKVAAPPAAPTTGGPNRLTIRVPSYRTKLNLGERDTGTTTSDPGVTAETQSHQHFYTFGAAEEEVTLVRMGKPSESVLAEDSSTDELIFEKVTRIPEVIDKVKKELDKGVEQIVLERVAATQKEYGRLKQQLSEAEAMMRTAIETKAPPTTILEMRKSIGDLRNQMRRVVQAPIQPLLDARDQLIKELRPVTTRLEYPPPGTQKIGSVFSDAVNKWVGYTMVTQGGAYHEAKNNYVVVSAAGEVRIAAEQAVTLGSPGDVIIGADIFATVSDLTENDFDGQKPDDAGRVSTYFSSELKTGLEELQGGIQKTLFGLVSLTTLRRKPMAGKTGWKGADSKSEYLKLILGVNKIMGGIGSATAAFADLALGYQRERKQGFGNVGIFGSSTVTMVSRMDTMIYSHLSTTLSASYKVAVTAAMASVTGLYSAGLKGYMAKVAGIGEASVKAHLGNASLQAHKDTIVEARHGTLTATSKKDAQLNSTDAKVYVHGTKGFFIGAGGGTPPPDPSGEGVLGKAKMKNVGQALQEVTLPPAIEYPAGAGWGIQGTSTHVVMGPLAKANDFTAPDMSKTHRIEMKETSTLLRLEDSRVVLTKDAVFTQGKELKMKAQKDVFVEGKDIKMTFSNNCSVSAGKILLG